MIEPLLDLARRRADGGADALWRRVERTSVTFEWGRLKAAGTTEEAGANLRVRHRGRVGVAGMTGVGSDGGAQHAAPLLDRALASAALGEELALAFPGPATVPPAPTFFPRAADAGLDALIAIGRSLFERLEREGCRVNVAVEREVADTRVANSVGAGGQYRSTAVGVSADVWRIAGDDVLVVGDAFEGADLPSAEDVAAVARSINGRIDRALEIVAPPDGALPVVFTPAGLTALMLPVTQALSGKAVLQGISPLGARVGEQVFDARFSLTDDALAPGRPATRPVDDECVPSLTTCLVERGVVQRFIYDLETAARASTTSTGHGQRSTFGKPVPGYTNVVLGVGDRGSGKTARDLGGGLLGDIRDGLLVDELIGVGQGNVIGGAFSHPVALAYRVERGEITGRVKDAAVAGNAYELWKRVGGFGNDARWTGSRYAPSVLLEGVGIARR
ncbi:MAG TPA: metallopeptidase TldD-related protein [Gemmatimonadales bacterium]|nr:metallopeptidase TldD-related protein [Gemmatimonadales bacterium]